MVIEGRKRYDAQKSFNSPMIWIKDKKNYDQVSGDLWRIHEKIYDLTEFIDLHPGGNYWLQITKGQDITDFFETSHINIQKAKQILQKYYVRDQKNPSFTAFTYQQDGFYSSLRKKVLKKLQTQQSRRASLLMLISTYFFLCLWFVSFYLMGKNPNIFTILLQSYITYYLIGVGHNFSHQNSKLQYLMNLTFLPHKQWIISHCLSHHTFCNLETDYQIIAFEPFLYFLTSQKQNLRTSLVYQFIIFFLIPVQTFIISIIQLFTLRLKVQTLLWLSQPFILWLVFSHSFMYSFYYWYLVHGLCSIIFAVATFPTHRSINIWTEGDPNGTKDFGIHILKTTGEHNQNMNSLLSMMIFQGFTDHSAHHMFPTVDRSKLHLINPLIQQTCKQFKITKQFKQRQYREMLVNYFKYLIRNKTHKSD